MNRLQFAINTSHCSCHVLVAYQDFGNNTQRKQLFSSSGCISKDIHMQTDMLCIRRHLFNTQHIKQTVIILNSPFIWFSLCTFTIQIKLSEVDLLKHITKTVVSCQPANSCWPCIQQAVTCPPCTLQPAMQRLLLPLLMPCSVQF